MMDNFVHNIPPVFNKNSRILILGSFPSVKSRENCFFYGHKQNRFWKTIAEIYNSPVPETIEQKKELLIKNRIALWDVIASCDIEGSSDSSITNVIPNNIKGIIDNSDIKIIFLNGKTAEKYYNKYIKDTISINSLCLPSTSPANASKKLENLIEEWKIIRKYTE